jgi:hypothetical protein
MTRINIGIDPSCLSNKHLLAEHREIKRIPNSVKAGKAVIKNIPPSFRLGSGHVKFFYNKLGHLLSRYKAIKTECIKRGFNITDYESAWNGLPIELMQDYTPTDRDIDIIMERLTSKNALK